MRKKTVANTFASGSFHATPEEAFEQATNDAERAQLRQSILAAMNGEATATNEEQQT